MERIRRRLALILAAMVVTLGGGTLGFVLIERYSVFDAFYMTLTTVTTVGYGEIHPLSHADELRQAGVPFVVVDHNESRVERAMRAGMLGLLADASRDETLREAGIQRAKGLIATLSTDADNLFLILTAKTLNPRLQLSARVAEESSEDKMRRAGADFVFAPYNSTGHRMAQAIVRPHVQQFLDSTTRNIGLEVGIEQVQVGHRCAFSGKSLADMAIRRETGVIVLAIRKPTGEMLFNPPPEATVTSGDHLIAMGEAQGLRKLENVLMGVPA